MPGAQTFFRPLKMFQNEAVHSFSFLDFETHPLFSEKLNHVAAKHIVWVMFLCTFLSRTAQNEILFSFVFVQVFVQVHVA